MLALSLYLIGIPLAVIALDASFSPDDVNVFTPMGYLMIALWPLSTIMVMIIFFYFSIREDMEGK